MTDPERTTRLTALLADALGMEPRDVLTLTWGELIARAGAARADALTDAVARALGPSDTERE